MENIIIEGSRDTYFIPSVNFDLHTGICEIVGESFLEDTIDFYKPLMNWVEDYIEQEKRPLAFIIKLSSSFVIVG